MRSHHPHCSSQVQEPPPFLKRVSGRLLFSTHSAQRKSLAGIAFDLNLANFWIPQPFKLPYCFQDVFHMGTHWMQAGGIFPKIMDEYMNALPDQPQRKLRDPDSALEVVQILMLFIVWGFGTTSAIIAFVVELGDESQSKDHLSKIC